MAQQLIFTSTPQGLEPGRTGYCTVARHKDLRHRLVRELERLSVYDFGQQVGGNRVEISIFRKITLGSEEFYVLSKICDAGLDYTNRTNYLAHHLILDGFEIATCPSPAEIFLNWNGWKNKWEEGARFLTPGEEITLTDYKSSGLIPCKNWLSFTNDPGNAASLVSPGLVTPIVLENSPAKSEHLLQLFAESSALLKLSLDAWDYSFTTFLQGNDDIKSFAWLGIEGQPAGERLKQGGLRNYIDLRNWTSSSISDEVDPALAHVARKGPTATPTKRVKSGTSSNTRSPLSQKQVEQIKGANSGYLSATPSGSTVKAHEASAKKEKKKRPWLLQLAVISTALCLLGSLIVGLAYNLGDWFKKGELVLKEENVDVTKAEEGNSLSNTATVAPGAFAQFDQVEYLKIAQKHPYLRWISLDVGSDEPLKININDDQFDRFEEILEKTQEGDELKVVLTKSDGEVIFDELSTAPLPADRGRAQKISFDEEETIAISEEGGLVSFVVGDETFSYDLRRAQGNEANRIRKLNKLLQSGQKTPLTLRLEGSRVVHIEPFELPNDKSIDDSNLAKTSMQRGNPMVLEQVKGKGSAYFQPDQKRILLPVNGTSRKAYIFKESESAKIKDLFDFLEKGKEGIDLNIRLSEDGEEITFLDFELPKEKTSSPVEDIILSPNSLLSEKKFLFWIPGVESNGKWRIDDSKKSLVYNDSEAADILLSIFRDLAENSTTPVVWMTDYKKGTLFTPNQFEEESLVEEFSYEYKLSQHPLDPVKIANISFKSGKSYSFDFEITEGKSIEISYGSNHAWNSLNNGKLIRFPLASSVGGCIDLFLLSHQHANLSDLSELGQDYDLTRKALSISSDSLREGMFQFLSEGENELYFTYSVLPDSPHAAKVFFKEPIWRDFIDSKTMKLAGLPTALIQLNASSPFDANVKLDLDYFSGLSEEFLAQRKMCEDKLNQLGSAFPNPEVYKNLISYGSEYPEFLTYKAGSSYDSYAYHLPLLQIQKSFYSWDEVRFKNLKGELDLAYNNIGLLADPTLFSSYWSKLGNEVEKYISDSIRKDFNYKEDKARNDVTLLFDFLTLILRTEKALGVEEGEFLKNLQTIRANLASPSTEKALGSLNKEILALSNSNPKLKEFFDLYIERYREQQRQLIPPTNLTFSSLNLAISTISDLGKNVIYKKKESEIRQNQFWVQNFSSFNQDILANQEEVIRSLPLDSAERINRVLSEIPWTLAVYKKSSNGQLVKQSDFLRLAPPSKF
ncbi:MAG: hypothetical protein P8P49_05435 [Opitutales bacterium]|nr:hypothetical protein [Opitutales bacterium]